MRVSSGWILGGISAVFVVVLVAVLAVTERGGSDAPLTALPVAAAADPLPRVKSRPLVFDKYAGKPRNDAVDSGTASAARGRRTQARQAAGSARATHALTPVSATPAPAPSAPTATPALIRSPAPASSSAPKANASSAASPKKSARAKQRAVRPTFKRGVLRTPDITIRITGYEIVGAGQEANEYGEKPVIAFTYRTTNVSGRKISAASAFIFAFSAYQDTDPDRENELDGNAMFDGPAGSTENIKKGRTVTNVEAFELDDLTTPVNLVGAHDLDPIGKTTYRLR